MKRTHVLLGLCLLALAIGCNRSAKNEAESWNESTLEMDGAAASDDMSMSKQVGLTSENTSDQVTQSDKIIRTADIGIRLLNYNKNKGDLYTTIKAHKGYVSNESEQNETYRISNTLTIRVPNNEFDALISKLTTGKGIVNVDYKRIGSQDVGEQYTDLEIRLKNKKEVEQQYLTILKQAKTITDILAVSEQVRMLREEIDATEGRLRYLSNQISFSTITLNVYQELEGGSLIDRPGFMHKLANALKSGWHGFLGLLVGITTLWPLWLALFGMVYLVRKRGWFRRKNTKA